MNGALQEMLKPERALCLAARKGVAVRPGDRPNVAKRENREVTSTIVEVSRAIASPNAEVARRAPPALIRNRRG